ncbi:hypothetical protein BBK82_21120 [Lentzea guizhouensis]|uniref:HNH nuclease domain-containing protein n=1 Tax=Lentzea guizhouensis TaxID=1586287 RepID=A0A1B2HKE8_9PSEU|nr:hypothetical protein BBK82_21120 [Lentzea guizhouensis]
MERRGAAGELGYRNLAQVLRHAVRWDLKTARLWVERAVALSREVTPTGALLEAELPVTAGVVAEGALSGEHVSVVAEVMQELPAEVERSVVDFALDHEPAAVRAFGKELAYRLYQDDPEPREIEPLRQKNQLRMQWSGDRLEIWAKLDKVAGAKFEAMVDPLAKPRPETPEEGPDLRFRAEREGDAFAELIDLVARADQLPEHGGEPVTMVLTMKYEDLAAEVGAAGLDTRERVPAGEMRQLACTAGIVPVVLGGRSEAMDIGRKTRSFPPAIRRLLVTRDRGCAFPGCERPPRHCDAHHVQHWADGGVTSGHNAVLLCRHHHTLIHRSGWQVEMVAASPVFVGPAWLDPGRVPRRNLLHAA